LRLFLGQVFDSLNRLPMVFHQYPLTFFIDPFVGIDTGALHVSVTGGNTPGRKHKGDHVKRFRAVAYEIKLSLPALDIGHGIRLKSMDKIREFDGIPDKENL